MSSKISDHRPRGRPRGFNQTSALEAAIRVFWLHGYAEASIDVLCRAMNVPRASLYQMYGDKEGLFLAAVKHYGEVSFAPVMQLLEGNDDLRADLLAFFNGVIDFATKDQQTTGCLVACALADAAGADRQMREQLADRFNKVESALCRRLETAQAKGQIPANPPAVDLAMMLAATARGLMLRARTGCGAAEMYPAAQATIDLCCSR